MRQEPEKLSVFAFDDPVPFRRETLAAKKRRHPGFSLRAWSRQLGFRTPSYLSDVLSGHRPLRPALAARVAANLRLDGSEAERFDLLVLRSRARDPKERARYDRLLRRVPLEPRPNRLTLDRFALVAEWYHWVPLELVGLPDFRPDPRWLSRRLGDRVRPELVATGLRRLLRLGLVRKSADGRWERVEGVAFAGDAVPSECVRKHHRQFLEKAKRALDEQPTAERDFRGSTFVFSPDRVEEARAVIRECHRQLRALATSGGEREVYRFGTQLFRLTQRPSDENPARRRSGAREGAR